MKYQRCQLATSLIQVRKSYIITDQKTAEATGLPLRTVQENRRLLIRHNLFYQSKTTNPDTTIYLYCALKEGVYSKKYFYRLFSCNSVSEVYKKYTRKEVDNILSNYCTTMETNDINNLLDDFHDSVKNTNRRNSNW